MVYRIRAAKAAFWSLRRARHAGEEGHRTRKEQNKGRHLCEDVRRERPSKGGQDRTCFVVTLCIASSCGSLRRVGVTVLRRAGRVL